jgi:hypothetical protein
MKKIVFCWIILLFSILLIGCATQSNKKIIKFIEYSEILNLDEKTLLDVASARHVQEQYDVLFLYSGRLLELRKSVSENNISSLSDDYVKGIAQNIWAREAAQIVNENNFSVRNDFNELLKFSGMWILICEKLDIDPYMRADNINLPFE